MTIEQLLPLYAKHPSIKRLSHEIVQGEKQQRLHLDGLRGSAAAMVIAAAGQTILQPFLCVLQDEEEAGYFYNDLTQLLGTATVLFFPSAFRRAAKYGQRDASNEILRTNVLERLTHFRGEAALFIVTHPEALGERIVSKAQLNERTLHLQDKEKLDLIALERRLQDVGF